MTHWQSDACDATCLDCIDGGYDSNGIVMPPRPWFWWFALGIAAALFGIEAWLVYRTLAGWPVDLPLLWKIAG